MYYGFPKTTCFAGNTVCPKIPWTRHWTTLFLRENLIVGYLIWTISTFYRNLLLQWPICDSDMENVKSDMGYLLRNMLSFWTTCLELCLFLLYSVWYATWLESCCLFRENWKLDFLIWNMSFFHEITTGGGSLNADEILKWYKSILKLIQHYHTLTHIQGIYLSLLFRAYFCQKFIFLTENLAFISF